MLNDNKDLKIIMLGAAQLNFTVGDTQGNLKIMLKAIEEARAQGLHMVVFPELALSGYPPEDLLYRPAYLAQINTALDTLMAASQDIAVIVGHPLQTLHGQYNALSVFYRGDCLATYSKQFLPNQQVFDERRYFEPGTGLELVTLFGRRFAFLICEDVWHDAPVAQAKALHAEIIIALNASPFNAEKMSVRYELIKAHALSAGLPLVYVNMVGGQDELIFDGGSFAMNAAGDIVSQAPMFESLLWPVALSAQTALDILPQTCVPLSSVEARVYEALVLGVRDYYQKNHFKGILLGLSGGIDSALTLAIAVDAVGAEQVKAYILPSRYSASLSQDLAQAQCERMNVSHDVISIEPAFEAFKGMLKGHVQDDPKHIAQQNMQARCRGIVLMALSNQTGHLLLTTGNKSEYAVGYATLYGDMCGGYAPLKDVYKTWVYRLAAYRNTVSDVIPAAVIDRAPTAELAPGQKDSDSLPAYDILDAILDAYVDHGLDADEVIDAGYDADTVHRVIKLLYQSEYKRRQSPPGPKVTIRAFGRDRRYPMTSGYSEL